MSRTNICDRFGENVGILIPHMSVFPANNSSPIDYDAKGQRQRIQYGNGSTTRYDHDPLTYRLTRLLTTRNSGADTLQDLDYTYDPLGNVVQITDAAQQTVFFNNAVVSPTALYEYDALYRLTKQQAASM